MVTSNIFPEKKVFKMTEKKSTTGAPHRTLLGEVNAHLTCFLCRGYYIDATTIVECLHSFCRSCIIKHLKVKSYCPVCEMMINSAKPNIKPDKALQDIVYKLVPGLFQKEMERRRLFYASRPGPAASATPEQRGEDTERIIFSPEDVISFSLEYGDITDSDSISSKSSDSNEHHPPTDSRRRFLQCPAVVNISHLKKFLCMKFDIDSTQYSLDILYKKIPLPEYYTLMDIAYIYNWKRNKPLRFVYQVIDYLALRNRYSLFDIKRKKSKCHEKPSTLDDAGPDSPSLLSQELGSEASSGADSPMPEDGHIKKCEINKLEVESECSIKNETTLHKVCDEDDEKSQFLNSFELTAKNNSCSGKSPAKLSNLDQELNKDKPKITQSKNINDTTNNLNIDDNSLKRKHCTPIHAIESKKNKTDLENDSNKADNINTVNKTNNENPFKETTTVLTSILSSNPLCTPKADNQLITTIQEKKNEKQALSVKRPVPDAQKIQGTLKTIVNHKPERQIVSPIKIFLPKTDIPPVITNSTSLPKSSFKKMPELKLGISPSINQSKVPITKVRMDLLANNCDPTMDRSKILTHLKSPMPTQSPISNSDDPLKSLFDSCKINIPSSLSITLTDQKLETPVPGNVTSESHVLLNKNVLNNVNSHKVPSPPVHNYIEILKIPETDLKVNQTKIQTSAQCDVLNVKKTELSTLSKCNNISNKQSDTPSAKGPIPSLKPIGETKLAKQSGNFPVTSPYQQKYIQSLEQSKVPRVKMQVPNLVPANVKQLSAVANKESLKAGNNKKCESKSAKSDILDLSTSHNFPSHQSQLGPQQTKTLATMQAIANIANKQTVPNKSIQINTMQQNENLSGISSKVKTLESSNIRSSILNQNKTDKLKNVNPPTKQDNFKSTSVKLPSPTLASPIYQMNQIQNSIQAITSPSQARSPSSSPKLVIAEDKHTLNICDINVNDMNQSNQISSTQCNIAKSDPSKYSPGPSKISFKRMIPTPPSGRPSVPNNLNKTLLNPTAPDLNLQTMYPQVMLRHLEWLKTQQARHQYEHIIKNMPNLKPNRQDFNKDKP